MFIIYIIQLLYILCNMYLIFILKQIRQYQNIVINVQIDILCSIQMLIRSRDKLTSYVIFTPHQLMQCSCFSLLCESQDDVTAANNLQTCHVRYKVSFKVKSEMCPNSCPAGRLLSFHKSSLQLLASYSQKFDGSKMYKPCSMVSFCSTAQQFYTVKLLFIFKQLSVF